MEEIFEKMPVITSDEIPASDNLVQKTCIRQQDSTNIFTKTIPGHAGFRLQYYKADCLKRKLQLLTSGSHSLGSFRRFRKCKPTVKYG